MKDTTCPLLVMVSKKTIEDEGHFVLIDYTEKVEPSRDDLVKKLLELQTKASVYSEYDWVRYQELETEIRELELKIMSLDDAKVG